MDKTLMKVLIAAALVFLGIAGLGVGTALFIRSKMRAAQAEIASDDGPSSGVSHPSSPRSNDDSSSGGPLQVKNGGHADLTEMVSFARARAAEKRAGAKLVGINAFGLHGGTADLDHKDDKAYFLYEFEFVGFDKSKPPGQDKIEESITVRIQGHDAMVMDSHSAMHLSNPDFFGGELPTPGCPSHRAFEAAVASGVPANAIARMTYEFEHGTKHTTWTVWVDGHDDYRRVIDATTCTIAKKDGAAAEAADNKGRHGHKHR